MPSRAFEPGSVLTKKVMEKIKFRLKLYQWSYAAKLANGAMFQYSY
jgi:hypothetical protein